MFKIEHNRMYVYMNRMHVQVCNRYDRRIKRRKCKRESRMTVDLWFNTVISGEFLAVILLQFWVIFLQNKSVQSICRCFY